MSEGPVISNAGPLIALSVAGCLGLLRRLYDRVLVPEAVMKEVVGSGWERKGAREVATSPWLERIRAEKSLDPLLATELGAGEAEVIAAGYLLNARFVLLDERRARRIAEQAYHLRVKGSAGILVAAKRAGLVPRIRPLLESMIGQGYFLSGRLLERALQEAGEL